MRFAGRCYRGHDPRWSFTPLSGAGAAKTGGRFNRPGTATLYLAGDIMTAVNECMQGFTQRLQPLTICEYDVDCMPIAYLGDAAGCAALAVNPADLACAWLSDQRAGRTPASWRIAEALRQQGFAGLLVPSFAPGARPDARNLVLWRWGPDLPTRVSLFDPANRLPQDQSSWR